jgi:predicted dehydrogenase
LANDKIVLGIVGIRGRGQPLALGFATRPDCEVAYLADCDQSMFDTPPRPGYVRHFDTGLHGPRAQAVEKAQGKAPRTVTDFRRVLDDRAVDAIVVGTPDHWHALATVWACQAGKDVFVEKPASHTPWEGRQMVAAARKYQRVVQLGTQSRSAPYMHQAREYIQSGKLGRVYLCRVYNQKYWGNLQAVPDSDPPPHLDWNMWNGPAPESRYNFNYWEHWNHLWQYSGGDIINDGIHQLDLARWLIGQDYPRSVYSVGGRFAEDGIYETPDTQVATYEFDDLLMTFELSLYTRYMRTTPFAFQESDRFPYWPQNACRIEIFGSEGLMYVGRHGGGWQVFGPTQDEKPVVLAEAHGRWSDKEHQQDFCDAIRTRRLPNADILEGHRSTLLAQYANISYRLGGQKLLVDPETETLKHNPKANALLRREYREPWVVPEVV